MNFLIEKPLTSDLDWAKCIREELIEPKILGKSKVDGILSFSLSFSPSSTPRYVILFRHLIIFFSSFSFSVSYLFCFLFPSFSVFCSPAFLFSVPCFWAPLDVTLVWQLPSSRPTHPSSPHCSQDDGDDDDEDEDEDEDDHGVAVI